MAESGVEYGRERERDAHNSRLLFALCTIPTVPRKSRRLVADFGQRDLVGAAANTVQQRGFELEDDSGAPPLAWAMT